MEHHSCHCRPRRRGPGPGLTAHHAKQAATFWGEQEWSSACGQPTSMAQLDGPASQSPGGANPQDLKSLLMLRWLQRVNGTTHGPWCGTCHPCEPQVMGRQMGEGLFLLFRRNSLVTPSTTTTTTTMGHTPQTPRVLSRD